MSNFPYAKTPTKLEGFFEGIQRDGRPDKASNKWLKSSGYTSSNDVSMINVLQFIGFVDSSRVPTDAWQEFRDQGKSKHVLAFRIRDSYSMLFDHYPDAEKRSPEDLSNFFRANTTLGDRAISLMVRTFEVLCSMADFSAAPANGASAGESGNGASADTSAPLVARPENVASPAPALHIDFQVHIAADAPPEQIDKIFESMAKHLYGKDDE